MFALVGILLVVLAGGTVIGVLWLVMQEKHTHEEHYIPQRTPSQPVPMNEVSAEVLGTEIQPTPTSDRAEHSENDTSA